MRRPERLGQDLRVEHPEPRVHRCQEGGDDPDPATCVASSDQSRDQDHAESEDQSRDLVRAHRAPAGLGDAGKDRYPAWGMVGVLRSDVAERDV